MQQKRIAHLETGFTMLNCSYKSIRWVKIHIFAPKYRLEGYTVTMPLIMPILNIGYWAFLIDHIKLGPLKWKALRNTVLWSVQLRTGLPLSTSMGKIAPDACFGCEKRPWGLGFSVGDSHSWNMPWWRSYYNVIHSKDFEWSLPDLGQTGDQHQTDAQNPLLGWREPPSFSCSYIIIIF